MISNFFTQVAKDKKRLIYIGKKVNHETLDKLGFFVVKNAFKKKTIELYKLKYFNVKKKQLIKKSKNHLVEVKVEKIDYFKKIYKDPQLKKIVKNFYNGNVGSDFFRIVKKDSFNLKPVFCHQDTGYQFGSFDKYSLFISLTMTNNNNGGLIVYPSTHKFGYLGDVGEISKNVTKNFDKICPSLQSGDVLIMHSSLWHESGQNFEKVDRIYLELHIQDINELSTKYNILGKKINRFKIPFEPAKIFSNSRTQRIVLLKNKIKKIERKLKTKVF
jgi:hypothetical protein